MADEFAKGFGILSGAGLLWVALAGRYRTHEFGGAQLTDELPENLSTFDQLGVLLMDAMFWFMILGTFTFWILIPMARGAIGYYNASVE